MADGTRAMTLKEQLEHYRTESAEAVKVQAMNFKEQIEILNRNLSARFEESQQKISDEFTRTLKQLEESQQKISEKFADKLKKSTDATCAKLEEFRLENRKMTEEFQSENHQVYQEVARQLAIPRLHRQGGYSGDREGTSSSYLDNHGSPIFQKSNSFLGKMMDDTCRKNLGDQIMFPSQELSKRTEASTFNDSLQFEEANNESNQTGYSDGESLPISSGEVKDAETVDKGEDTSTSVEDLVAPIPEVLAKLPPGNNDLTLLECFEIVVEPLVKIESNSIPSCVNNLDCIERSKCNGSVSYLDDNCVLWGRGMNECGCLGSECSSDETVANDNSSKMVASSLCFDPGIGEKILGNSITDEKEELNSAYGDFSDVLDANDECDLVNSSVNQIDADKMRELHGEVDVNNLVMNAESLCNLEVLKDSSESLEFESNLEMIETGSVESRSDVGMIACYEYAMFNSGEDFVVCNRRNDIYRMVVGSVRGDGATVRLEISVFSLCGCLNHDYCQIESNARINQKSVTVRGVPYSKSTVQEVRQQHQVLLDRVNGNCQKIMVPWKNVVTKGDHWYFKVVGINFCLDIFLKFREILMCNKIFPKPWDKFVKISWYVLEVPTSKLKNSSTESYLSSERMILNQNLQESLQVLSQEENKQPDFITRDCNSRGDSVFNEDGGNSGIAEPIKCYDPGTFHNPFRGLHDGMSSKERTVEFEVVLNSEIGIIERFRAPKNGIVGFVMNLESWFSKKHTDDHIRFQPKKVLSSRLLGFFFSKSVPWKFIHEAGVYGIVKQVSEDTIDLEVALEVMVDDSRTGAQFTWENNRLHQNELAQLGKKVKFSDCKQQVVLSNSVLCLNYLKLEDKFSVKREGISGHIRMVLAGGLNYRGSSAATSFESNPGELSSWECYEAFGAYFKYSSTSVSWSSVFLAELLILLSFLMNSEMKNDQAWKLIRVEKVFWKLTRFLAATNGIPLFRNGTIQKWHTTCSHVIKCLEKNITQSKSSSQSCKRNIEFNFLCFLPDGKILLEKGQFESDLIILEVVEYGKKKMQQIGNYGVIRVKECVLPYMDKRNATLCSKMSTKLCWSLLITVASGCMEVFQIYAQVTMESNSHLKKWRIFKEVLLNGITASRKRFDLILIEQQNDQSMAWLIAWKWPVLGGCYLTNLQPLFGTSLLCLQSPLKFCSSLRTSWNLRGRELS